MTDQKYPVPGEKILFPRKGLIGLMLVGSLALVACAKVRPAPRRPSVVLVVVDTLRRDHLSCYGYPRPTTPALDEFAAGALRFDNAFSQAPWTTPSIAALLTSRFPSELGIHDAPDRLDDRFVTLAETLQAAGYRTGAVISHYFLGSEWNFQQGFESFDESNVLGQGSITSHTVTDRAVEFARAHAQEPFFLFVHYFDPHYDYIEHPGYRFGKARGYRGPIRSGMAYTDLLKRVPEMGPVDRQRLIDLYDSEVGFTDHHIGRLFAALRELGLYDSSLIVVTADHGEEFLDHGGIGHGATLYNEAIRVPLLFKQPGGDAPRGAIDQAVGLVGIYPTILDLLGLDSPGPTRGASFASARPGRPARRRLAWSESSWGRLRSVENEGYKLIRSVESGEEWFYVLAMDPGEHRSQLLRLYRKASWRESFGRLEGVMSQWIADLAARPNAAGQAAISDELRERLRALGYLR